MCRWLTYCGDPIYLDSVIFERANSLIHQSLNARHSHVTTNGDGFGVGWYAERNTPGVFRDILPAWNDTNLRSIAHQIRSGLFFAHVRSSTGTETSRANCHPFHHGKWLFMHNGQIGGYGRVRRRLEAQLDDRYYTHRNGTTDSELMFYMMFTDGLERDPLGALHQTLARVREAMHAESIDDPLRFTAVFSDGHHIYAVRHASDDKPPSLFWRESGEDRLVVSEPLDDETGGWQEVPPEHVLITERRGGVELHPLDF